MCPCVRGLWWDERQRQRNLGAGRGVICGKDTGAFILSETYTIHKIASYQYLCALSSIRMILLWVQGSQLITISFIIIFIFYFFART